MIWIIIGVTIFLLFITLCFEWLVLLICILVLVRIFLYVRIDKLIYFLLSFLITICFTNKINKLHYYWKVFWKWLEIFTSFQHYLLLYFLAIAWIILWNEIGLVDSMMHLNNSLIMPRNFFNNTYVYQQAMHLARYLGQTWMNDCSWWHRNGIGLLQLAFEDRLYFNSLLYHIEHRSILRNVNYELLETYKKSYCFENWSIMFQNIICSITVEDFTNKFIHFQNYSICCNKNQPTMYDFNLLIQNNITTFVELDFELYANIIQKNHVIRSIFENPSLNLYVEWLFQGGHKKCNIYI